MAATRADVDRWIKTAKNAKQEFVISVCDTFDWDDYPVYCDDYEQLQKHYPSVNGTNMQRVNEIIWIDGDVVLEGQTIGGIEKAIAARQVPTFSDFLNEVLGKSSTPTRVPFLFVRSAVNPQNLPIIYCNQEHANLLESLEISDLNGSLDQKELNKVPSDLGFYTAILNVGSVVHSHPEDPTEYDTTITLSEIKKVSSIDEAIAYL